VRSELALHYFIPGAAWTIQVSAAAVSYLKNYRQINCYQRETVGQLFSPDLTSRTIRISEATVLTRVKASRASVTFDPEEAAEQRTVNLQAGLYCVGLWHTHPETAPKPSRTDERLAADHAAVALSVLNGLCFVIVGTAEPPDGWYFGIHDGKIFHDAKHSE
jgi:proteasome lid subunit RPN8/RPN11